MEDSPPKNIKKIVGYDGLFVRRGEFTADGLGRGRLYMRLNKKPFIYVYTKDSYVIINFKEEHKTKDLYDRLISAWKSK